MTTESLSKGRIAAASLGVGVGILWLLAAMQEIRVAGEGVTFLRE